MEDLPNEIQRIILSHLSEHQTISISRVCKLWHYLTRTLTSKICKSTYAKLCRYFLKENSFIDENLDQIDDDSVIYQAHQIHYAKICHHHDLICIKCKNKLQIKTQEIINSYNNIQDNDNSDVIVCCHHIYISESSKIYCNAYDLDNNHYDEKCPYNDGTNTFICYRITAIGIDASFFQYTSAFSIASDRCYCGMIIFPPY